MKERLKKKLKKMNPPGSRAWFYREFIHGKIPITGGHFEMMLSDNRTMRDDVKVVINEFLNQE